MIVSLMVRSALLRASRTMEPGFILRDAAKRPLLRMRSAPYTFSNGKSIWLRFSSHSGTGRFFERMKSGLNSFD
jgi:hypothetical protein